MVAIKPGTPIKRKDDIPEGVRTEKRDTTANVIDELWPTAKTEIAEEADVSRTHVDTVLEKYFEPINPNTQTSESISPPSEGSLSIEIPPEAAESPVAMRMYFKGVMQGVEISSSGEGESVEEVDMAQFFRVSEPAES